TNHIAFPATPQTAGDVVWRCRRWPQTITIVVFRHGYQSIKSTRFCRTGNLIGVKMFRVEQSHRCIPEPPFLILERSRCKMNQTVSLHFMPVQLRCSGYRPIGSRLLRDTGRIAPSHPSDNKTTNE